MHDQVGTLRTRGTARDALALRGAAERALAGLTLAPAALPDAAILCVRRVQARADLRQALQCRASRQAAVQAQAQAAWATAARPALGPVSAACQAVWFADESELLACLAHDTLRGGTQAWWWAALLGRAVDAGAVQRRWLGQAAAAPAALQWLARWGQAAAVLRAWPADFCTQLSAQLAGLYGVSAWPPQPASDLAAPPRAELAPSGGAPTSATTTSDAAWQSLLRHGPDLHTLAPPQQQLWALAALLALAPAQASQPGVAARLQAALADLNRCIGPPPAAQPTPPEAHPGPAATGSETAPSRTPSAPPTAMPEALARQPDPKGADAGTGPVRAPAGHAPPAQARPGAPTSPDRAAAVPWAVPLPPAPLPDAAWGLPTPAIAATPAARLATPARSALSARSPHAGLLYALRLALQLGLYGDFSQPRQPGIALAPADLLALLGLRLFGPTFRQDPLWPLLSAWAGRAPADDPGLGFLPADGQALQPWLAAQLRSSQRLARQALPRQRQALRWLCQRPGRWVLSSSRLDAHFSLADHPLAIRQAGLDRDPGWVPAAGRSVWLHFD